MPIDDNVHITMPTGPDIFFNTTLPTFEDTFVKIIVLICFATNEMIFY